MASLDQPSLLITGLPQRARSVASELICASSDWQIRLIVLSTRPLRRRLQLLPLLRALRQSTLFYQIGGAVGRGRLVALAQALGVPTVIHWVGSDVLDARRYLAHSTSFARAVHWAVAPWLVEELARLGIQSELVPLPWGPLREYLSQPPPPLPDHFTVLSYLPDEKPELYARDMILQLAHDFPTVRFLIVGGRGAVLRCIPPNLRFLGRVRALQPIYAQTNVLVRLVQHDGAPRMIQEALALGRHVIWSYPAPGVLQARDYSELKALLGQLWEAHCHDQLSFNWEGHEHIRNQNDPDRLSQGIVRAFEKILR